jgi:phosphoadenosine phosphosulfate reductase
MRLEASPDLLDAHPLSRVAALRMRFEGASPERVLEGILAEFPDHSALVSSFGAEAAVLLHMVARIDPGLPVLLVDTLMLFEETLQYQRDLSAALGLLNVQHLRPDAGDLARLDPYLDLNRRDPDACCVVRKVAPLDRALRRWPVVISGRKRFQAATREGLEVIETDGERLRVNPLAHWSAGDLRAYMDRHDLPRHPLVARGYPSIGCAPCTSRVAVGEDPRSGRWRGQDKVECGIHFGPDGRVMPGLRKAEA